jgi:hypothetical protein
MATHPIDFKTVEGQRIVTAAIDSGDLRYVDGFRLLFPEEKATLENMEIRELYDNAQMYQGRVI